MSIKIAFAGDLVPCNITNLSLSMALSKVEDELNQFDCKTLVTNLESSLPAGDNNPVHTGSSIVYGESSVFAEAVSNTDLAMIFSLANNHIADYGLLSIQRTRQFIEQLGADGVGASCDPLTVRHPIIIEVNRVRIGILAFCSTRKCVGNHLKTSIGDALALLDEQSARSVSNLKTQVDHVVVLCHWGREFVHYPLPEDIAIAHGLIDAGASLIVGHHPHVLQGFESYKKGLIFYSLGNFIFPELTKPQILRWRKDERTGVLAIINFEKKILELQSLVPIRLSKANELTVLHNRGSQAVINNICKYSSKLTLQNYTKFFERQVRIMVFKRLSIGIARNIFRPRKTHLIMLYKLIMQGFSGRKSFID